MVTFLWCALVATVIVFLACGGGEVFKWWARLPVGIGVPLVAAAIVLLAPQMADMFAATKAGYGKDGYEVADWRQLGMAIGVFFLGLQSWFWMRTSINAWKGYRDADAPPNMPWHEVWAPRLTLLPVLAIAWSPVFLAIRGYVANRGYTSWGTVPWTGVIASLAFCALIWGLASYRRYRLIRDALPPIANQRPAALESFGRYLLTKRSALHEAVATHRATPGYVAPPEPDDLPWSNIVSLFIAAPGGPWVAGAMLAVAIIFAVLAQASADWVNDNLHTTTAAFLALGSLIAMASVVVALLRDVVHGIFCGVLFIFQHIWAAVRPHLEAAVHAVLHRNVDLSVPVVNGAHLRTPVNVLALLCLVAVPLWGGSIASFLYKVRTVDATDTARPDIAAAAKQYKLCLNEGGTTTPAIIVALEGGASRSAAWSLSAMRMLDLRTGGGFGRHLFAITSVSGGSLAAMTYSMAMAKWPHDPSKAPTNQEQIDFWNSSSAKNGLVELARVDLLTSTVGRLFSTDILFGAPTRAASLTGAFEHFWSWNQAFDLGAAATLKTTGFLSHRAKQVCLPHLLLNGSDVDNGGRLLTSTLNFAAASPNPFSEALDVVAYLDDGRDIRASDAVLNSARFPIISPPGYLDLPKLPGVAPQKTGEKNADYDKWKKVVDGGVYENYGARTAWELAAELQKRDPSIRPIVVIISNDVDYSPADWPPGICLQDAAAQLTVDYLAKTKDNNHSVSVPEVLTSVLGLLNTRQAHSLGEINTLKTMFCRPPPPSDSPHLLQINLSTPDASKHQSAPMNWVLDQDTCSFILGDGLDGNQSPGQAQKLRDALGKLGDGKVGPDAKPEEIKALQDRCKEAPAAKNGAQAANH